MRRYKGESDTKSFEAKVQGLSEDDIPTFDILVLLTWTCSSSCEAHAAISAFARREYDYGASIISEVQRRSHMLELDISRNEDQIIGKTKLQLYL